MKFNLLILAVVALLTACTKEPETRAVVQDIKELVFASGQIEWKDGYNLVAQTDGILEELQLEIGDEVQAGQRVGNIQNSANTENLQTAEQQLAIARQNTLPVQQQIIQNIGFAEQKYQQDKKQAERYERLYSKQSVSKQEYENMKLAAENSLSQLNALKDQLESAKLQSKQQVVTAQNQKANSRILQSYNELRISEKGKVIKKLKTKGDFVRRGDVIATIANEQQTEILLNVDESSIAKVKVGQVVFVRLNTDKEKTQNARISEILSAFDESSQSFICKAKFDDSTFLPLYGTQLEANILVGEKKNALLVPRNLVGFGNTVRVKGKEEKVILKTGIVSTDYVEVLGGITKDDVLLSSKP
jgi:multidrug efflux pump subunit AcrA (membrane-fusion protein)